LLDSSLIKIESIMDVIIVEDEELAVDKLKALLHSVIPQINIQATLDNVKDAVRWIKENPDPDIGFFDIQLSDDISFEIFNECNVNFPVVFITAYDDYLLQSFQHNSIYYILKPVTAEKIGLVINKLKQLEHHFVNVGIRNFIKEKKENQTYKTRLIVKKGIDYAPLETDKIAYIFTDHKISFVRDVTNQTYIIDLTLSELGKQLDPNLFFRANRQYIIHLQTIRSYRSRKDGKIKLDLLPESKEDVIIGKENAVDFRKWIKGE